jgi:hypothetical protein
MATSFQFIKATPYSAVYNVQGDGVAGTMLFDPTMKANLVAGPLKAELTARNGALDKLNLDQAGSPRVRIHLVTGINATQTMPSGGTDTIAWTTTGLTATLALGETGTNLLIEIRFVHSAKR